MATGKRGPHKLRKPTYATQWTEESDTKILKLSDAGKTAADIAQATGLTIRPILRRLKMLRGGTVSPEARPKGDDLYGMRTPEARRAEAAIAAGLVDTAFDDSLEWHTWDLAHTRKLAVKEAANRLNIGVPQVWEALAKQKVALADRAAGFGR